MAKAFCLTCNSARVPAQGPYAGELYCLLRHAPVGADCVCFSWGQCEGPTAVAGGRDHVLVKSDPKAHFGPLSVVSERGF